MRAGARATVSQPTANDSLRISAPCIPDPNGGYRLPTQACRKKKLKQAFYNVERLRKGLIPYGYDRWPDGSRRARVVTPVALAPTSDDRDSRMVIPAIAR